MRALYTVLVALLAAAHFAFLAYLPAGGFLALRKPRSIVLHVGAVCWAVGSVTLHLPCPLTAAERWARAGAGMAPMNPGGFIDHYITGSWHPAAAGPAHAVLGAAVLLSWVCFARRVRAPRPAHLNRIS